MATRMAYQDAPDGATAALLAGLEAQLGFTPNSLRVMARQPALLRAFLALGQAVLGPDGLIDGPTRQLVAYAASLAAGCRYCQAHTAHVGAKLGLAPEKLAVAWDYERAPAFTERERAAMRFAQSAASVPNATRPEDFAALRRHFSEDEITALLGIVALFGFLNRWNDTLATELEAGPAAFAQEVLAPGGWSIGKHHGAKP